MPIHEDAYHAAENAGPGDLVYLPADDIAMIAGQVIDEVPRHRKALA